MIVSKRLKTAVICFLLVFFFLLARLAEIQLFFTESFSKSNINLIQKASSSGRKKSLFQTDAALFLIGTAKS